MYNIMLENGIGHEAPLFEMLLDKITSSASAPSINPLEVLYHLEVAKRRTLKSDQT